MSDVQTPAPAKKPKRVRPPSRIKRWEQAVSKAESVVGDMRGYCDTLADALAELREVQEEYENWKDNLPENLANSPLGEKLEEVCNIQIEDVADTLSSAIDDAESAISEAAGLDLPRGFGKD